MACKCCDGHCHHEEIERNNYSLLVFKIAIAIIALILGHFFEDNKMLSLIVTIVAYLFVSYDIFVEAFKEVKQGEIFSEFLLMIIATIGAFFIGEYHESIMVMLLFIVGELLQGKAVEKSRESIVKLVGVNKSNVSLKSSDGIKDVDYKELKKGDLILLKKGDMLLVDGVVISGKGYVDASNLTGESIYKEINAHEEILSGVINVGDILEIEVLREYKDSKINKVLSLVEDASDRKSKSDKIIRKIAKVYTPIVIFISIMIVLVSWIFQIGELRDSIYTALTFLLISCPCAIIISVPITYFAAIGGASKKGVLIKGANFLDVLYRVKNIAFDKTGTLSEGKFSVSKVLIKDDISENEFIELMLLTQKNSNHPISKSICKFYKDCKFKEKKINKCNEVAGKGVVVRVENQTIIAGNKSLMNDYNIICDGVEGSVVHLAKDNVYLGYIFLEDKIKDSSYRAMKSLKKYKKIMLSGDNESVCKRVSEELGIDEYYADLLPEEKMKKLEEIIKKGQTMFVGDGVNDTLSISLADVSVAMGIRGSDASIEYSDIVIENDNLENIDVAFKFAKKVRKIILENLIAIMSLKVLFMVLSLFGYVNMWIAIFSDVGLCILSIINSMRASKIK